MDQVRDYTAYSEDQQRSFIEELISDLPLGANLDDSEIVIQACKKIRELMNLGNIIIFNDLLAVLVDRLLKLRRKASEEPVSYRRRLALLALVKSHPITDARQKKDVIDLIVTCQRSPLIEFHVSCSDVILSWVETHQFSQLDMETQKKLISGIFTTLGSAKDALKLTERSLRRFAALDAVLPLLCEAVEELNASDYCAGPLKACKIAIQLSNSSVITSVQMQSLVNVVKLALVNFDPKVRLFAVETVGKISRSQRLTADQLQLLVHSLKTSVLAYGDDDIRLKAANTISEIAGLTRVTRDQLKDLFDFMLLLLGDSGPKASVHIVDLVEDMSTSPHVTHEQLDRMVAQLIEQFKCDCVMIQYKVGRILTELAKGKQVSAEQKLLIESKLSEFAEHSSRFTYKGGRWQDEVGGAVSRQYCGSDEFFMPSLSKLRQLAYADLPPELSHKVSQLKDRLFMPAVPAIPAVPDDVSELIRQTDLLSLSRDKESEPRGGKRPF